MREQSATSDVDGIAPALPDAQRWRWVLLGLDIQHVCVPLMLVGFLVVGFILILHGEPMGHRRGLLVGVIVGHVIIGVVILLGLLACYSTPPERARRFLHAALILGLLSLLLVVGAGLLHAPEYRDRFPIVTQGPAKAELTFLVLLLNGLVALICWFLYLRELARYFQLPHLSARLHATITIACLWGASVALFGVLVERDDFRVPGLGLPYSLAILGGAGFLVILMDRPLRDLRQALGAALKNGVRTEAPAERIQHD